MEENFLRRWSEQLNVREEDLQLQYEAAKQEMESHFPNQSTEVIAEKAMMKMKIDYKSQFASSTISFVGILIGSDSIRDPLTKTREMQMSIYNQAKETSDRTGDYSHIQKVLDEKIVRLDGNGLPVPLWSRYKKDGGANKLAGKDISPPEISQIRTVYGVGTSLDKNDAKGFILELKGKMCKQPLPMGKMVRFKAYNRTQLKDNLYLLDTYDTEFISIENSYMQEGIDLLGLPKIILDFFKDYIITWSDINSWMEEKKNNPHKDVIPEKFKYKTLIIDASMCIYQNFEPDQKDRIKINICDTSDDVEGITSLCLMDKSLDDMIDFSKGSKVIVIGRPWIPEKKKEEDNLNFIFMTSGVLAYPDWKISRIDAVKLAPENIITEEPAADNPEKTKIQDFNNL